MLITSKQLIKISLCITLIIVTSYRLHAQYWAAKNEWNRERFYANYKNLIEIAFESTPNSSLKVRVSRGELKGENGVYYYYTNATGNMTLSITRGRDTLFSQEYYVHRFPTPCVCVGRRSRRKLRPEDFSAGIWVQNPVDNFTNLEVVEMQLDYLDANLYSNTITLTGSEISDPRSKLVGIQSRNMWIEKFSYRKLDGSIETVKNPEVCECSGRGVDISLMQRQEQEKFANINSQVIEIFEYPQMYATLSSKSSGQITKEEFVKGLLGIQPFIGSNTFGFAIQEFTVRIMRNTGRLETYTSKNGAFTKDMQEAFSFLQPGERIEIGEISAANYCKKMSISGMNFYIIKSENK